MTGTALAKDRKLLHRWQHTVTDQRCFIRVLNNVSQLATGAVNEMIITGGRHSADF